MLNPLQRAPLLWILSDRPNYMGSVVPSSKKKSVNSCSLTPAVLRPFYHSHAQYRNPAHDD